MNVISETTKEYQRTARNATKDYLNNLVSDFSECAEDFLRSLEELLKTGTTDDNWICLSDKVVEQHLGQVFFDKSTIESALESFAVADKNNIIDVVDHIYYMDKNFQLFYSFRKMQKLKVKISQCELALQLF